MHAFDNTTYTPALPPLCATLGQSVHTETIAFVPPGRTAYYPKTKPYINLHYGLPLDPCKLPENGSCLHGGIPPCQNWGLRNKCSRLHYFAVITAATQPHKLELFREL